LSRARLASLPATPGSYLLVLEAVQARRVRVGALGHLALAPGFYVYAGSAFGPGGLAARLAHHLRRSRSPRWHIDYLRRCAEPCEIWVVERARREHAWARALAALPSAVLPCARFGASDCRCPAHLVRFARRPGPTWLRRRLGGGRLARYRIAG